MKISAQIGLAAASAVLAAGLGVARAEHPRLMYDLDKTTEINGMVKEFQYTNPQSWLIITTVDPTTGAAVNWGFESEGPSTLLRAGIKRNSLQPGDHVVVKGHPLKDGRPAAELVAVTKADGAVLSLDPQMRKAAR